MTITPWHSGIDFDIAKRHGLDYEQIIDWRGKLLPIAGEFAGMNISEAREKIVNKLSEKGLLVKIDEKYSHAVPCSTNVIVK
jgi:valyl-tRNA synthetase